VTWAGGGNHKGCPYGRAGGRPWADLTVAGGWCGWRGGFRRGGGRRRRRLPV